MVLEEVYAHANKLLSRDKGIMMAIKTKCWVYHSESRIKNGNPPFSFSEFNHRAEKGLYLDYINLNLIDCLDIGGREVAITSVHNWYY